MGLKISNTHSQVKHSPYPALHVCVHICMYCILLRKLIVLQAMYQLNEQNTTESSLIEKFSTLKTEQVLLKIVKMPDEELNT